MFMPDAWFSLSFVFHHLSSSRTSESQFWRAMRQILCTHMFCLSSSSKSNCSMILNRVPHLEQYRFAFPIRKTKETGSRRSEQRNRQTPGESIPISVPPHVGHLSSGSFVFVLIILLAERRAHRTSEDAHRAALLGTVEQLVLRSILNAQRMSVSICRG